MSGHNKWSTIKHKKAKQDAKRGKIFTKLIRELTVSAKEGGGDIETNPRLRLAVQKAKDVNMPKDNIDKAIKKGTGELPGVVYEDIAYEGYGPGGVAIYVETLTDNKNRTAAEVRHTFSKYGGSLGANGCVSWMFDRKGMIILPPEYEEDQVMEDALEAGAEDIQIDDEAITIYTAYEDYETVRKAIEEKSYKIETAELTMIPQNTVECDESLASKILKMLDKFDESDDVQNVYGNFNIPDDIMEKLTDE